MDRPPTDAPVADPHSHARPDRIAVRHLDLELDVDFERQRIAGVATWGLVRRSPDASDLVLDTWRLEIEAVTREDGTDLPYELGDHDSVLGQALTVHVGDADRVVVRYATTPGARALQWLEPEQTASGQAPFLFTQSQAILARSWIPCQDTPGRAGHLRRHRAGAAGPAGGDERREPGRAGERTASTGSRCRNPIPSYLIALGRRRPRVPRARSARPASTPSPRSSSRRPGSSPTSRR